MCQSPGQIHIATHAPVRGATHYPMSYARYIDIATHAPVRGATMASRSDTARITNCNPRSCTRSDPSATSPPYELI